MNVLRIQSLLSKLDEQNAHLIAVTKHHPPEEILLLYEMGLRDFGENRVQELLEKKEAMPGDIRWHMIGHLQRKKVKKIAPFIHLIQSLDRIPLWEEIDKQAKRNHRIIPALLEIKVAKESSKTGFDSAPLLQFLKDNGHLEYPNVRIDGIMGMASFTADKQQVKNEFEQLHNIFIKLKRNHFKSPNFQYLSMGMSGDFTIALEAGSNMVRIGSLLFSN